MKLVLDSCSLIYLAKINRLSILNQVSKELLIDKAVFNESVVSGRDLGYRDAHILDRFVEENIKVISQDYHNELDFFGAKLTSVMRPLNSLSGYADTENLTFKFFFICPMSLSSIFN